jgi:hypothetical protein
VCSVFFCDGPVVVNVGLPVSFHPHNAMMMLVNGCLIVPGPKERYQGPQKRQPKKLVSRKRIAVSVVQKQQKEGPKKTCQQEENCLFFCSKATEQKTQPKKTCQQEENLQLLNKKSSNSLPVGKLFWLSRCTAFEEAKLQFSSR